MVRRRFLLLGDERGGIDQAGRDQVEQAGDVAAVIAVTHPHNQVFVHGLADRVSIELGRVHADSADGPGFSHGFHRPLASQAGGSPGTH